ncbi:MAG: hypothetical protein IPO43_10360 [Rhodoferax sp.]|nr:hypothetical protein [Rhodoferax sp.]
MVALDALPTAYLPAILPVSIFLRTRQGSATKSEQAFAAHDEKIRCMTQEHQALVTNANDDLWKLERSWQTAKFSPDDGIGPMDSLHQAGDSLVAVIRSTDEGFEPIGSGVMIGPGLLLTATHVLKEIAATGSSPLFMTFLRHELGDIRVSPVPG